MGRKNNIYTSIAPPVGLMIAIFLLSSIPGQSSVSGLAYIAEIDPKLQNLLHVPLFGLLQVLWLCALTKLGKSGWYCTLLSISICILYSIFDELHQMLVPGRYASLMDIFFNFTGISLGTLMFLGWQKSNFYKSVV